LRYRGSCHCGDGNDAKGNDIAAITICCLEGLALSSVPVTHFDGRSD